VANRVEVQTGLEDSNFIEILSGIDDTSRVVTLGQHTLKSGSYVTITNAGDGIAANAGLSAEQALATAKLRRTGQSDGRIRIGESGEHHHP